MKVEILADVDATAQHAAEAIAAEARAAVKARGCFSIAISGGRTPWVMLRALSGLDVPWQHVHVLQVDERIPAGHPTGTLRRTELLVRLSSIPAETHALESPTSPPRRRDTRRLSPKLPDRRRSSISCISAWVRTATRRRWFPAIRCSRSRMPTWRSPGCTRDGAG
jgi:6-phosphogluconolactonase/glucosamine-6-phosphate isomerase/deaminase